MTVTAFDSDVLIYAGTGHPLGGPVRECLEAAEATAIGSVLLLTEVLAKPQRIDPHSAELLELENLLARVTLLPLDLDAGEFALELATAYKLRAADAAHLATAIIAGADQFLTNNRKDFPKSIAEIAIVYPEDLA